MSTVSGGHPLFQWLQHRAAGVLLHPTSLPGDEGVGTLGTAADRFLEFLEGAGFRYWQVCPLGPTGFGDSPYQCFSAFAGNPYLIDLEELVRLGLLAAGEVTPLRGLDPARVDFGQLWERKWPLLFRAYERFRAQRSPALPYGDFAAFCHKEASWLEAYATFRALKDHHRGAPWWEWPAALRSYAKASRSSLRTQLATASEAHAFFQYLFFGQWARVRAAAARRRIEIIGDVPIFVAHDSADVWAEPHGFELDEATGHPLAVAGVPPDYFAADGQLWGNPLYRWEAHAADGFAWWKARLRASFALCDVVRIDHFRGFDAYWRIPFPAENARHGRWVPGPGLPFFQAIQAAFPHAKIIAEDLGEVTESVNALRVATGLPGMAVLQFAFGGDADNLHLPHNLVSDAVVYPGTHDNDTTLGWYAAADEATRDHVRRYLRVSGAEIGWDLIRAAYAAVSRLAVIPMQDILSLGGEARLNLPGRAQGNWQWRCQTRQLDALRGATAGYLQSLAVLYGRQGAAADAPGAPLRNVLPSWVPAGQ